MITLKIGGSSLKDIDSLDQVIRVIQEKAKTGQIGDGKVFVLPVEQVFRIRTGESGEEAI